MLPTCRETGIGFVRTRRLDAGFLAGRFTSPDELDMRLPPDGARFTGDNLEVDPDARGKGQKIAARRNAGAACDRVGRAGRRPSS